MSSKPDLPKLTIVGGQPERVPHRVVPTRSYVGVEKLLLRAARDDAFRKLLLADRTTALEQSGVELVDSECAMLGAASPEVLQRMIDNVEQAVPRQPKFLRIVAAATASLAAGTVSCSSYPMEEQGGANPCYQHDACYEPPDVVSKDVKAKDTVSEDVASEDVAAEDVASEAEPEAAAESGPDTAEDSVLDDVESEAQDTDSPADVSEQDSPEED